MTKLVDLDLVAAGEVQVAPAAPTFDDLPTAERTWPTIKESTFKAKVKFRWREEQSGATTWHYATCTICSPLWMSSDTMRSRLLVSTSDHKTKHWLRATGNTPTNLEEGS
jgi:hypothetical protein